MRHAGRMARGEWMKGAQAVGTASGYYNLRTVNIGPKRPQEGAMEDRIIALEETVALQGKTIDDLSDVIAAQQRQIDRNERMLKAVATKLHAMFEENDIGAPSDEPPPHY